MAKQTPLIVATIRIRLTGSDLGERRAGSRIGMDLPKRSHDFFPEDVLRQAGSRNPPPIIRFEDQDGISWSFKLVKYEKRLPLKDAEGYFRKHGLRTGDEVVLCRDEAGKFLIFFRRISKKPWKGEIVS